MFLVTGLASPYCICFSVGMLTLSSVSSVSTMNMIAVIAHSLGIVRLICVRAMSYHSILSWVLNLVRRVDSMLLVIWLEVILIYRPLTKYVNLSTEIQILSHIWVIINHGNLLSLLPDYLLSPLISMICLINFV